jgi:predicted transposase YbfD/YdcC
LSPEAVPAVSSSPTGLAAAQLTRLNRVAPDAGDAPPAGLLDALRLVPDPRDPRGIRYGLAAVLGVAVCATLAGAQSYLAIAEWAADAPARLRAGLGLRRGAVPDPATIWRVLTAVDPARLDAVIGAWVRSRLGAVRKARRRVVLAVDGKTLRGARPRGGTAPHLMACLDHATGTVIAQIAVDGRTNEITMLEALLDQVPDLGDALITMDALHAQREHAAYLHKRGAHYLVTVKGNQPGLLRQLRSLPWKDVPPGDVSAGRAHGRAEKRTIKVVTVTAGLGFPHAARAIQITRKTRRNGSAKWKTETSYAITSLPAAKGGPDQLAAWIRGHWKIENQLHWVRDVTFGEDLSPARTGTGPHVMAALRNLAISILRLAGHASIAAALRRNARDPARPYHLVKSYK